MRTAALVLTLVLGSLLVACSSAPTPPEGINDRKNQAADYLRYGQTYYQQGKYQQALEFFQIALDLNTAVDHIPGTILAYNSASTAYLALGKVDEARRALDEAVKLEKDLGNPTLELQTLNGLVQADLAEGKVSQAWEKLNRANPATFPATKEGAILFQDLGTVLKNQGKTEQAVGYLQKSLDINSSLKLKQEMASNYFMIASVQSKAGTFDTALATLEKALALDKEMENTLGIGQDYRALGLVWAKKDQKSQAYQMYLRSVKVYQSAQMSLEEVRSLDLLIPLAADLGLKDDQAYYEKLRTEAKDKYQ